eukprot:scaffold34604_cov164-Amphora_coffeaeformis.AAC.13
MRFLILTVGSRGDVEPFVALADKILKATTTPDNPNIIEFFVQPEYKGLVPLASSNNCCRVHTWPFTQQDFYTFLLDPKHGKEHENPRVRFVGVVADIIEGLVLPQWKQVLETIDGTGVPDVIVTSALARSLAFALGAKWNNVPTALVHLQPLLPNNYFPHSGQDADACVRAILKLTTQKELPNNSKNATEQDESKYYETYAVLERYQHDFLQQGLDQMYQDMGLSSSPSQEVHNYWSPSTFETNMAALCGQSAIVGIFNCFAKELIPPTNVNGTTTTTTTTTTNEAKQGKSDNGCFVYHVGALGDAYVPVSFEAWKNDNSELMAFLKTKRPICVGYGSMPFSGLSAMLEALETVGHAALLVGEAMRLPQDNGSSNSSSEWVQENVRQVDALPYAWLLPQCRMMLSHGGAGVLHATLRAGIPSVITPMMGDQFFWAKMVQAKGLGTQAGSMLSTATKDELVAAIKLALTTDCIEKARQFGEKLQGYPKGVDVMYDILTNAAGTGAFP